MAEWSVTGTERDVLLATKLYLPGQRGRGGQVAWLSLDAGDNDPARFWRHVVAALDRARPATGDRARELNLIPSGLAPKGETCRLPRFPGMRLSFSQMPYLA
jgi:hypothetical protein